MGRPRKVKELLQEGIPVKRDPPPKHVLSETWTPGTPLLRDHIVQWIGGHEAATRYYRGV